MVLEIAVLVATVATLAIPALTDLRETNRKLNRMGKTFIAFACVVFVGNLALAYLRSIKDDQAEKTNENLLRMIDDQKDILSPNDFQLTMISFFDATKVDASRLQTGPVRVGGSLDSARIFFEFVQVGKPETVALSRAGGVRGQLYHNAEHIKFDGLDRYRYLRDLNGKTLEIQLPRSYLDLVHGGYGYSVQLYIKGRLFRARLEDNRSVKFPIAVP